MEKYFLNQPIPFLNLYIYDYDKLEEDFDYRNIKKITSASYFTGAATIAFFIPTIYDRKSIEQIQEYNDRADEFSKYGITNIVCIAPESHYLTYQCLLKNHNFNNIKFLYDPNSSFSGEYNCAVNKHQIGLQRTAWRSSFVVDALRYVKYWAEEDDRSYHTGYDLDNYYRSKPDYILRFLEEYKNKLCVDHKSMIKILGDADKANKIYKGNLDAEKRYGCELIQKGK